MSYEANTDLEAGHAPAASNSLFGQLVDALNAAGSVVIGAVMVLMCADVLMRNLFNHPLDGVAEMVAASIIIIVFLQLPSTLRHGRMSRADLFIDPFIQNHRAAGMRLRALFSLFGIFACGVISYASWPLLTKAWTDTEFFGVEGVFTMPVWPMRAVVVLGAGLAAVQYVLLVLQDMGRASQGKPG
jgi:TRAP-type mannitol/chloroaromatic compound transport system permease small subunit